MLKYGLLRLLVFLAVFGFMSTLVTLMSLQMNKELSCRSLCSRSDTNLPPAISLAPQQLSNRMHLSYGVAADFTFPHPVTLQACRCDPEDYLGKEAKGVFEFREHEVDVEGRGQHS